MSADPNEGAGEVAVTDKELFDNSVEPPAPSPEPPAPPPPSEAAPSPEPPAAQTAQQKRDELGRFAAGRQEPPAAGSAPTAPTAPTAPQQPTNPLDQRVPLKDLLDIRERAQRAEAQAAQMQQALHQLWQQQQAAAMAAQQQQQPMTLYDNPDQFLLQNVVEPIRQEGRMEFLRMKDEWSREMADTQHGEKNVQAALDDLAKIRRTPQGDFVFNQIMSQRHPYGALVKWHNHARMQQQIGPDPNAWLKKQQEAWLNDPKVHAEVVKRIQGQQQASGRPPTVNLPPSLSSLPSAGGDEQGDLSNESLYRFATR